MTGGSAWGRLRTILPLLSVLYQIAWNYLYPVFGPDKGQQIAAAQALLEGHGLSLAYADPGNLSQSVQVPLLGWPPGYSLLIAPFLKLFGNVWWAALAVDGIAIVLFVAVWFQITELLGEELSDRARLAIWAYWTIIFSPLVLLSSSEMLTMGMYSLAVLIFLHLLRGRVRPEWLALGMGLCLGLTAWLRFAYWPLLPVLPALLLIFGLRQDRRLLRAAALSGGLALLLLGGVLLYRMTVSQHATVLTAYFADEQRAPDWSGLAELDPFPARLLGFKFDLNGIAARLRLRPVIVSLALWLPSLIILAPLMIRAATGVARLRRSPAPEAPQAVRQGFYLSGAATLIVTLAMLSYLVPFYPTGEFQHEARYFAPVFGFIFVAMVAYATRSSTTKTNPLLATLARLTLVGFIVAIGCWQTLKLFQAARANADGVAGRYDRVLADSLPGSPQDLLYDIRVDRTAAVLHDLIGRRRAEGLTVVYIDLSGYAFERGVAIMAGAHSFPKTPPPTTPTLLKLAPAELAALQLRSTEPVSVLVLAPLVPSAQDAGPIEDFITRHGGVEVGKTKSSRVIELRVGEPASPH